MSLTTSLIAYWKMDESSGNAADSSGSGFNLTNNNSIVFDAGLINNGADTGTNLTSQYFSIANNLGIAGTAVTISLWIKLNTEIPSGQYRLACQYESSSQTQYRIQYEFNAGTRRIGFVRGTSGTSDDIAYKTVTLGTSNFVHVVLVYDSTNVFGYINNVASGTTASSGTGSSSTANFFGMLSNFNESTGATANDGVNQFFVPAHLDEVGIWSRSLSSTEVGQLYNSGVGLQYPFGLLGGGHLLTTLGAGG